MQKIYEKKFNKNSLKGFTLVELSIVMAVFAILVTMTVSFTVLVNRYAKNSRSEYEFLENCSSVKDNLLDWVAELDSLSTQFDVTGGQLRATKDGQEWVTQFADGVLSLGEFSLKNVEYVDGITFVSNGELIKCVIYRAEGSERTESSFVFAPRIGDVVPSQSIGGGSNE